MRISRKPFSSAINNFAALDLPKNASSFTDAAFRYYLATKVFREIENKIRQAWLDKANYQANDNLELSSDGIIFRDCLELYCTSILHISPDNISYTYGNNKSNYNIVLNDDAIRVIETRLLGQQQSPDKEGFMGER